MNKNIVPIGRKRGRPRSENLNLYRSLFKDIWSPRTIARYARAMRLYEFAGFDTDQILDCVKRATRANGTFNIARLAAHAEVVAAFHLIESGLVEIGEIGDE